MNAVVKAGESRPVPATESAALLEIISRAATDPSVNIDKMERLLQMQERISARQAESEFHGAMTMAQSEMGPISADAHNPQTHSKYASYAKLDSKLRPIYTRHGFSLSFDEGEAPTDSVMVLCHVSHRAGYSRTYRKLMPADGKGAKGGDVMTKTHAAGAAMSYGMRYLLKGIFNVAVGEEDRDGNDAGIGETLNEQEIANIDCLLAEVGADKAKFLRYARVQSLDDIPRANYSAVIKTIEAKRKRS